MKFKMALMGRKFEDNPIYKKLQAPLAGFKTQDSCKCFQKWCYCETLHRVARELLVLQRRQHGIEGK
jgi:hypothetical protein